MKIAVIKIIAASFVVTLFTLTGCKKAETGPKGDQGPQGPQGPVVNMMSGGFITGTITGTRRDGTPFTEPFNYTYYFPGNGGSGTLDSLSATSYNFNMQRQEADIFSSNSSYLYVTTTSKTASTGTLNINVQFEKTLSASKIFMFSGNTSNASATGLSYNASTGLFSGNFNITLPGFSNNTGNSATIVGSFQATMTQLVYKQHQGSALIVD